jgi:hypothetical protein
VPKYIERPETKDDEANTSVDLPYGMDAKGVVKAINDMYSYLHALNKASIEHGYNRLEDIMQPAGFSGLMSNIFVRSIAKQFATARPGLAINTLGKGRPDLVPRAVYENDAVLRGEEGIEVKVSRYASGWQGHNPETGWVMVIIVSVDTVTEPVYDRAPMHVDRVVVANLDEEDWNFSGRSATSRRTPTASINATGYAKLAKGEVYLRAGLAKPTVDAAAKPKKAKMKVVRT